MTKYVPKVGEAFEWFNTTQCEWVKANKAVLVTDNEVCELDDDGMIDIYPIENKFRPITIKADVERDRLLDIMNRIFYGKDIHKIHAVQEIQKAGFTIPKKVERSYIWAVICENSGALEFKKRRHIEGAVLELLGDLVEGAV